jgi:hypothetical protein
MLSDQFDRFSAWAQRFDTHNVSSLLDFIQDVDDFEERWVKRFSKVDACEC